MRKILLALCVLLLTSPAWAAEPIIQGDAQFVYSQEIDGVVNPEIESVYKYTSVISASPAITLEGLDAIFPSRLDGMAFSASYTHEAGKSGIYPGTFIFQFTKDDILDFPNGAAIMDEIEGSGAPIDVLFKYFDPVFVIYGPDGEKISVNIKNFSFDFEFITGDYNIMALSFPVVLADGYPDTFCIEYVSEYPVVYDAMVSETNAGVSGDGNIEVAFALVPNEKATDVARYDFPILEPNGEKGYVIFDDPSEYLDIPEMSDVSAAIIASGETSFTDTENGFSFETSTESEKNAAFVHFAVHSDDSGTLAVNGYPLDTDEILLPDGTRYLTADFVLVNKLFGVGILVSEKDGKKTVFVFDGATDDVLAASVEVVPEPSLDALFYHERGSFEASYLEGLPDQTENVSGTFSSATLPLLDNMTEQVAPVNFEATIDAGSSVFGIYEFSFFGDDVPDIDADAIREDINNIFDYVRPVLSVDGITFDVYDYLATNERTELISISGSLQTGFSIKVPILFLDKAPRAISLEDDYLGSYLHISDGNEDGVLNIGSYIGIMERASEIEEALLLSTPEISLKKADLQIGLQEADAVFELAEAALWPGKAGVSAATHIVSFTGTYGGEGKYVPLDVTISVTAEALQALSRNGYNTVLSVWEENPFIFFDYFHVYKQVGDFVYDLVMMGGKDAFMVSGDPTTRVNISFQVALIDDVGFASFDFSAFAFIIYDGERDGRLVDPLFIGVPESGDNPERPVFNSPGVSLKLANIDASSLGLEEAEADFEYLGLTDWPGKEGVLDAVSVGSFEGEYDGSGKYVPLRMEVSVTSYDLDRLSKDRHSKVISKWAEDRAAFLDYFHVYKQIDDLVYDLVMLGGKDAFTVSGDPTTRVTVSFPAVLIDDAGNTYYDEEMGFVIYDGDPDGKLVDPLFVGTPEQVPVDEGEDDEEGDEELKHILPDNPEGSSTGHSDLDKWFKIFSLF